MTPTREQVIEWAEEAGITSDDAACQIHDLTQLATIAMAAGRDQGLREAKEVCECKALASALAHVNTDEQAFHIKAEAARSCAAAIEQLRACWSAATPG